MVITNCSNIYQAILFPSYKEGRDVITSSIKALLDCNYDKKKIIVALTVEERAGKEFWDNALAHKKTVVDFGEYSTTSKHWKDPARKDKITFLDCYHDYLSGANELVYTAEPDIESLRPLLAPGYVGWELGS